MKECKNCGRTGMRFWSKRHLTCIECLKLPPKKPKPTKDFKYLVKQKRYECNRFIFSKKNTDDSYHVELGCTFKKIRNHLESKFEAGMTWDNHGAWHIDHITPLSNAMDEKQLNHLLRWQNVRPLWAEANLRKKDGRISNEKLIEINKKMEERYYQAMEKLNSGIVKTKTTREMYHLLKDFGIVTMNDLIRYARSIGYEKEGDDLWIKRRKI